MALTLKLEIATPEGTVYSEDAELVTIPAVEGEMGVYPQHIRVMTNHGTSQRCEPRGGL